MTNLEVLEQYAESRPDMTVIFRTDNSRMVFMNSAILDYYAYADRTAYPSLVYREVVPCFAEPEAEQKRRALENNHSFTWHYWDDLRHSVLRITETRMVIDETPYIIAEIFPEAQSENTEHEEVRMRESNEILLNKALGYAMDEQDADTAIYRLLMFLGEHMYCDRAYIFEETEGRTFSNTYEWCREGVKPEIQNLQNLPYKGAVDTWYREFDVNGNIIIRNLESYKQINPVVYGYLKPQNIQTLTVGPIIDHGRRIGFYGLDNPPLSRITYITDLFEILGHFISILLKYRDKERKLSEAGLYDQLTGLYNRHALYKHLDESVQTESLTYIFCDLNGLKKINDEEGHDAGDRLIQKAAHLMMEQFDPSPVFRMGGDEFLGIVHGCSEEDAKKFAQKLQQEFDRAGISCAVGTAWNRDGYISSDVMFHDADADMYRSKEQMYEKYGWKRR